MTLVIGVQHNGAMSPLWQYYWFLQPPVQAPTFNNFSLLLRWSVVLWQLPFWPRSICTVIILSTLIVNMLEPLLIPWTLGISFACVRISSPTRGFPSSFLCTSVIVITTPWTIFMSFPFSINLNCWASGERGKSRLGYLQFLQVSVDGRIRSPLIWRCRCPYLLSGAAAQLIARLRILLDPFRQPWLSFSPPSPASSLLLQAHCWLCLFFSQHLCFKALKDNVTHARLQRIRRNLAHQQHDVMVRPSSVPRHFFWWPFFLSFFNLCA